MKKLPIILASGSPRRKELLEMIGLEFQVMVSNQEESYISTEPEGIVKELALKKARHVFDLMEVKEAIVIGADTIVVVANQVLEKPKDEEEAFEMIKSLQNNQHQVFTGVAILKGGEDFKERNFVVETRVVVNKMTEIEIWDYIKTGEPFDKAGGYGIQGGFAKFIEKINGDFYNVMGLPVARLYQELKEAIAYGD